MRAEAAALLARLSDQALALTVLRRPRDDFGGDALAAHLADAHRG